MSSLVPMHSKSSLSSLSRTVGLELDTLMRLSDAGVVSFTAEGRRALLPRFKIQGLDPLACTSLSELRSCFKELLRLERAQALSSHGPLRGLDLDNRRFLKSMLQSLNDQSPPAVAPELPASPAKVIDLAQWRHNRAKA